MMGTYDNAFGGALHDPMFDEEEGCEVCMQYVDDCTCPVCPVCEEQGNPACHGLHIPPPVQVTTELLH